MYGQGRKQPQCSTTSPYVNSLCGCEVCVLISLQWIVSSCIILTSGLCLYHFDPWIVSICIILTSGLCLYHFDQGSHCLLFVFGYNFHPTSDLSVCWLKHTGQTLWSHLPRELTVHRLLLVRCYDWGSSGGMPSCGSVDIVLVLMQNFLKCSLRVFNLGLVNQVWNLLLAEAQHQVGCSFVVVGEDVSIFEFGRTCRCWSKLSRLSNL